MLSYVFNVLLTLLLIGLITGSIIVLVFALYVKAYINPTLDVDLLTSNQSQTTMLYYYDDNGVAVEMEDQRLYGSENRLWVSYDQIPKHLCDAFIAIEDKRFESHHGVDWITTLKATFGFLTNTDSAGGSTITQQLIKNLYTYIYCAHTAQSAGDLPCAEFGEAVFQRTNFGDVPQHGVPVSGYVWGTGGIL